MTSLLDGLAVPYFALDRAGKLVAWGEECSRATGHALGDLVRDGWQVLFPQPDACRRWLAELARRRKGGFRDWEWQIVARSGQRRVLSWSSVDLPGPVDVWATWATGRDVTEARRLGGRVAALEEELSAAQSVVDFGLWDLDPATNRVRWSPELERLYGLGPGGFRGGYGDFLAMIHPEDRSEFERRNAEMESADLPVFEQEFRILRADGAVRWIRSRSVRLRDGRRRLRRVLGVNLDVTDQRRVAESLKEKDEYLQVALKSSKLVVWHQDQDLRYTWVANPGLGVTSADVIGRTDPEIFPEETAAGLLASKHPVLRTGQGIRTEMWVSFGGRRGCYDMVIEPQRDALGRISGIVGAATDVTERALAQEELEQARRQLQRLALRLQDTIEDERRAIAQDMHDQVGALLTGIRMGLANLVSRLPAEDRDTHHALQQVAALADRAASSTREICARIQPPSLEDVGLAETCRWYLRDWSRSTGLHAAGRFPRLAPEPPAAVSIDLFRTLQELLTNAARHSGGTAVRVGLSANGHAIRLRVSDDGHGFDRESARRGLGFTGLRERAARHGGRLEVRSGPGGSTVTVTLPWPAPG